MRLVGLGSRVQGARRAQGDRGAGAETLRRAPADPPRLPFTIERAWQENLWRASALSVTCILAYLGHAWQPPGLLLNQNHILEFPSHIVGTIRTPLYQDEVGRPKTSSPSRR